MELGSIKLASEELGLAQSTLSEHLKQVEQSLDTLLFTRGKNGLQITPQGQSLYRYTHLIFKTADKIKNIFSTDEEITNCIDVGILTSVTNSRTSKFLIPLFDDENTLVRIHQGDSDFLVKRFIHREIDLFLTDYKLALPHLDGLESEYLGSMSYVLVYNSNYQEIKKIYSIEEAIYANQTDHLHFNKPIKVRLEQGITETTVGRIIFNRALPKELPFITI